ncbi:LacI family transcriptional regulator [Deinobacterium chartae]|uniref:LacI family transcriptional regulator n=1 Tax=Deinobacterium chartae TaxID=521158 RepID=A0A841HZQ9_9DEIO|nr:LacI family DNA-binding transcriptional regulator [Deinobacterium chartae]MBB6097225.1 LacI family transcriptional regulator [Deinobacterium chartae]
MKQTIQSIALRAGVSKGTVSRVINGHSTVKEETRRRVLAVMEEVGYTPDPTARELSLRSKYSLGLSMRETDRRLAPYFVLFREALARRLQELGIPLVPLEEDLRVRRLPSAVLILGAREGDPRLELLAERQTPAVLIGHHPRLPWVAPDDEHGAYLATAHLIRLGHRTVAHLGNVEDTQAFHDRHSGYRRALEEAGLRPDPSLLLHAEPTALGGYRSVRRALEGGKRFSALFAAGDEMAVGAIAALEDFGLRVPGDVSVAGFDGLPEIGVRLTTVEQDIPGIALAALELALACLEGTPPQGRYVPVRLRVGDTTAPLHSGETA